MTLGVTAGGGGGQEISFPQCTDLGAISWMAYQDGDGPWTAVTPVGTTFTFELQEDRGAIALVQVPAGTANIFVLHLSTEEIKTLSESGCNPIIPPERTVTGSVAGGAATDFVNLSLGPLFTLVSPAAPNFQFVNLPEGSLDLIASLYGSAPIELKKIIIRRDLNPAHNDVLPVLDFDAAEAVAPVVRNLTVNNILGETTSSFVRYVMSHGANGGLLFSEPEVSANPNRMYHGVPAPAYQAGDLHRITVQATSADLSTTRTLTQFIGEAEDQTVTLPPAIGPTPVTVAATAPYVRLRVQYTSQAEFDQYYTGYFTQTGEGTLALNFSGAFVGGGAIDFTLPDFSAMPGWNGAWGFQPGTVIEGSFNAAGWTGGALGSTNPVVGTIIRMSGRILDEINP